MYRHYFGETLNQSIFNISLLVEKERVLQFWRVYVKTCYAGNDGRYLQILLSRYGVYDLNCYRFFS